MTENPYTAPNQTSSDTEPTERVYRDAEDELLDNSAAVRVLGTIAFVLGCFIGHSGVYAPLQQALASKQTLVLHSGAVGVSICAVLGGTTMLIAGRHTRKLLMHRWYDATPLNVFGTLIIVALAILGDIYLEQLLVGLGYVIQRGG